MELFGTTRSRFGRSHALIAPDSFVTSDLPGWQRSQGIIVIAPRMGARFTQYIAVMEALGTAAPPAPGVERVLYVLEGQVSVTVPGGAERISRARRVCLLPHRTPRRRCGRLCRRASTCSRSGTPRVPGMRPPTRSAAT